jgi:hypothetical protein
MIFVKKIVNNNQGQEIKEMKSKIHLSGMASNIEFGQK